MTNRPGRTVQGRQSDDLVLEIFRDAIVYRLYPLLADMSKADGIDQVTPDDLTLTDGILGYNIRVHGEYAGAMEAVPGHLEYIELEAHWEGKGVARAALKELARLSQEQGETEFTTNNATHPAMEHILKSEGFKPKADGIGWVKEL